MTSGIEAIRDILRGGEEFIIAGHTNPDGDCVGACFALAMGLEGMGKRAAVLLEPIGAKYGMIPGRRLLYMGELKTLEPRIFIALDCSTHDRLGEAAAVFDRAKVTVCVDHHVSNGAFAMYNLIRPEISSTSELIFELLGSVVPISRDMAAAIYAGIVFDTGGFRHSSTGPDTHAAAGRLVGLGIPFTDIYNSLLYSHTPGGARIFGKALETLELFAGGRAAYCRVTFDDMLGCGAVQSDLDGIVEYALNTGGVEAAVLLSERSRGEFKASLRSKTADVSAIAVRFGGGGHRLAAGCSIKGTLDEAAAALLPLLERAVLCDERNN